MTYLTKPNIILKWTAMGMRTEGIGEYVELREYRRLLLALETLKKDSRKASWRPQEFRDHVLEVVNEALKSLR